MPELPEIETIKRGLAPHVEGKTLLGATLRFPTLRWPIPPNLDNLLHQQVIRHLERRGKYLLFHLTKGTLLCHLGMSGSLRLLTKAKPLKAHDHVDIHLEGALLRYNDPRRFGALLWSPEGKEHPLLSTIGIEPLCEQFNAAYLKQKLAKHRSPIKTCLMNSKLIAGIGNIYAAEALFLAAIHPMTLANQLSLPQCEALVAGIKTVLQQAIAAGGTTLKDYVNSEGKPGYFSQQLLVYGRANKPCTTCHTPLQALTLSQRNTVFCPNCQKEH